MITGAARSVAALLGNSTHFSTGSATGPLAAAVRGSDIKVIAASYNKFPYAFVVKPEIRSPKDLRGKRVNILNYGGSNDLALQLALKEWGLKHSDVQVIIGGDAPTRMGALMAGRIDATILSPPHLTIAVKAGYRVLADMGDMSTQLHAVFVVREGQRAQGESRSGETLPARLRRSDPRHQDRREYEP